VPVEQVVPDDEELARPNRAARRTNRKEPPMPRTVLGQPLTPRERDVLRYIEQDQTAWDIAKALRCPVEVVRSTIGKACRKLGARNADHAVQILHVQDETSTP
jgi:DNA-binding CsgD family transcriptional regulator